MEGNYKLYSQRAISITTFFGGPLAAGILIRQNFISLNKEKQGKNAFYLGIITTIIIFGGLLAIPESTIDKIPNAIVPAIYTGIIYLIVDRTQGKELKSHKENNGEFYSAWKAAKIGAVSMIVILFIIFSAAFISGDFASTKPDFDAKAYDKELSTFFENEAASLKVFQSLENHSSKYLKEEVKNNIAIWNDNKVILENANNITNLPDELLEQNKMLDEYCDLRIQHFELILKALTENTNKYDSQIQSIGLKIEKKINELK